MFWSVLRYFEIFDNFDFLCVWIFHFFSLGIFKKISLMIYYGFWEILNILRLLGSFHIFQIFLIGNFQKNPPNDLLRFLRDCDIFATFWRFILIFAKKMDSQHFRDILKYIGFLNVSDRLWEILKFLRLFEHFRIFSDCSVGNFSKMFP